MLKNVKNEKTYVTENKIRIRTFYRTSVVNKILVLGINIFHLAYLSYILRIYKTSSNDEKRTLPKLKTQQDWKEEFPFFGVHFNKHNMQTLH